ncbi:integral membrane protein [Vibrio variabilis]|uniref:Integral membrane protein n=1 Tax=Vibrio variabilis TaxID=990271 RepID=A0ABQ0JFS9_9VIBR|nr:integral membrane protein [Vibrio variabilis]
MVSVIDPMFTFLLVLLVVIATIKRNPWFARVAMIWALAYPLVGMVQRDRAEVAGWQLAKTRQHQVVELEAKPSFANILVWKVVYETEDRYFADAVRVGRTVKTYPGESINKLVVTRDFPWLDPNSQQAKDVERFRWFSHGYLAQDPNNSSRIMDVRYSVVPNEFKALWSIELSPTASTDEHANYVTHRGSSSESRQVFYDMLFDR